MWASLLQMTPITVLKSSVLTSRCFTLGQMNTFVTQAINSETVTVKSFNHKIEYFARKYRKTKFSLTKMLQMFNIYVTIQVCYKGLVKFVVWLYVPHKKTYSSNGLQ